MRWPRGWLLVVSIVMPQSVAGKPLEQAGKTDQISLRTVAEKAMIENISIQTAWREGDERTDGRPMCLRIGLGQG